MTRGELAERIEEYRREVRGYLKHMYQARFRHYSSVSRRVPKSQRGPSSADLRDAHGRKAEELATVVADGLTRAHQDATPLLDFLSMFGVEYDHGQLKDAWCRTDVYLQKVASRFRVDRPDDELGSSAACPDPPPANGEAQASPAAEKAFSQYRFATEQFPELANERDRRVYDWLAAKPDAKLPSFETWRHHVGEARRVKGVPKKRPRRGRTGRNIVRDDEI